MKNLVIMSAMALMAINANAEKVKFESSGVVADSIKAVVVIVSNDRTLTQTFDLRGMQKRISWQIIC